jgi:hypothetical protein
MYYIDKKKKSVFLAKDGVQRSRLLQHPNYLLIEIKKIVKKREHKSKSLRKRTAEKEKIKKERTS